MANYSDVLDISICSLRHNSDEVITGKIRDALDALNEWLSKMKQPIQYQDWVLETLLETISIDLSAQPTASELKGVLCHALKACPEVTSGQLESLKRVTKGGKLGESS